MVKCVTEVTQRLDVDVQEMYPRRTSFSDPKGYFGKIIKLLGNNSFLCITHFRTIFKQYV